MKKDDAYYLAEAIQLLLPEISFSFNKADYSTIKWGQSVATIPTQLQIDAAIVKVKENESAKETQIAQNKAAAEAKLAALGLTTDDLKALGL